MTSSYMCQFVGANFYFIPKLCSIILYHPSFLQGVSFFKYNQNIIICHTISSKGSLESLLLHPNVSNYHKCNVGHALLKCSACALLTFKSLPNYPYVFKNSYPSYFWSTSTDLYFSVHYNKSFLVS